MDFNCFCEPLVSVRQFALDLTSASVLFPPQRSAGWPLGTPHKPIVKGLPHHRKPRTAYAAARSAWCASRAPHGGRRSRLAYGHGRSETRFHISFPCLSLTLPDLPQAPVRGKGAIVLHFLMF
jgi:hypothetical protein